MNDTQRLFSEVAHFALLAGGERARPLVNQLEVHLAQLLRKVTDADAISNKNDSNA